MKRRPDSHITDSEGERLLRSLLPAAWVVRPYQPDYGIDFAVEVFDTREGQTVSLGEHFFIQLKSHAEATWIRRHVVGRRNVEKTPLRENPEDARDIRVISEPLETPLLQLARSMGPAVRLLLVVCDLKAAQAHWVCLNDFADKVLVPEVGDLASQASHTVHVPHWNMVSPGEADLLPLRFLARRGKLYAAFNRFRYQQHELQRAHVEFKRRVADDPDEGLFPRREEKYGSETDFLRLADHFLSIVLAYDFWTTTHAWPAVHLIHQQTVLAHERIRRVLASEPIDDDYERFRLVAIIMSVFNAHAALANMFEDICREWFLPTYLGAVSEENAFR